ncbi:MAG: hypothetical protein ACRDV1_13370 [Actinomycetes bacterium]
MKPSRAATRRQLPTSPFSAPVAAPVQRFAVEDRVTHDQYGLGSVVAVESDIAVVIDFGGGQLCRITSPFAKLNLL